jgi:hypothetical protein
MDFSVTEFKSSMRYALSKVQEFQGSGGFVFSDITVIIDGIWIRKMYRSYRPARLTFTMLKWKVI